MSVKVGDLNYNGMPVFDVGVSDFLMFGDAIHNDRRILSKNIVREDLKDFYKRSRGSQFGIRYEGIIIPVNNIKE
jgi:hypothetical protein